MNHSKFTDKELYQLCKRSGAEALEARRKFAGMLPEVQKRELTSLANGKSWLEKRGYASIYHFAAKLAGMSSEQVDMVLRLEKRFSDKPALYKALTEGDISVNKLARIASIATVENQAPLAEKIEVLSQKAVEVFVQDYKNENGLQQPQNQQKSLRAQSLNLENTDQKNNLQLDEDVLSRLLEMQEKGININAFLRVALEKRQQEITAEKETLAAAQTKEQKEKAIIGKPTSRYVPVKIVRLIRKEHGIRCSAPNCRRPAENLHHEDGFAITKIHDPRFLKPLCVGHHELAHMEDQPVQTYRRSASGVTGKSALCEA